VSDWRVKWMFLYSIYMTPQFKDEE